MTCRELAELLLDYLAGELETDRCQHIRAHLEGCPHCVTYVQTYQITIRMTRQLPAAPLPPDVARRLEEALKSIQEKQ